MYLYSVYVPPVQPVAEDCHHPLYLGGTSLTLLGDGLFYVQVGPRPLVTHGYFHFKGELLHTPVVKSR